MRNEHGRESNAIKILYECKPPLSLATLQNVRRHVKYIITYTGYIAPLNE